jgi:hypothetical protein
MNPTDTPVATKLFKIRFESNKISLTNVAI